MRTLHKFVGCMCTVCTVCVLLALWDMLVFFEDVFEAMSQR